MAEKLPQELIQHICDTLRSMVELPEVVQTFSPLRLVNRAFRDAATRELCFALPADPNSLPTPDSRRRNRELLNQLAGHRTFAGHVRTLYLIEYLYFDPGHDEESVSDRGTYQQAIPAALPKLSCVNSVVIAPEDRRAVADEQLAFWLRVFHMLPASVQTVHVLGRFLSDDFPLGGLLGKAVQNLYLMVPLPWTGDLRMDLSSLAKMKRLAFLQVAGTNVMRRKSGNGHLRVRLRAPATSYLRLLCLERCSLSSTDLSELIHRSGHALRLLILTGISVEPNGRWREIFQAIGRCARLACTALTEIGYKEEFDEITRSFIAQNQEALDHSPKRKGLRTPFFEDVHALADMLRLLPRNDTNCFPKVLMTHMNWKTLAQPIIADEDFFRGFASIEDVEAGRVALGSRRARRGLKESSNT